MVVVVGRKVEVEEGVVVVPGEGGPGESSDWITWVKLTRSVARDVRRGRENGTGRLEMLDWMTVRTWVRVRERSRADWTRRVKGERAWVANGVVGRELVGERVGLPSSWRGGGWVSDLVASGKGD